MALIPLPASTLVPPRQDGEQLSACLRGQEAPPHLISLFPALSGRLTARCGVPFLGIVEGPKLLAAGWALETWSAAQAPGSPVRMVSILATTCRALSTLKHIGGLNFRTFLQGPSVLSKM